MDDYRLELPGNWVELQAENDAHAAIVAKRYLADHGITEVGLHLYRYPKEWVNRRTAGLIEVPFYQTT